MAATEPERDSPKDIKFDSIIVDVVFHPEKDVIVAGDIDGDITVHSYSLTEDNHELMKFTHHKKACRCLGFSPDGARLFTGSKDKSLCAIDMERGALVHKIKKAHSSPLYSLCVADENIIATGDDEGTLKVWDMRTQNAVMEVQENDDFISDMFLEKRKRVLLTTSGDGTLSAFDIRKHKLKLQSELFDSELLSLAVVKEGEKVVVGNGEGALHIFNWGEWGNISDRFPGHPMSIDCMVPLNDDIIVTGSFDGIVRAVNILPNRFLGVVGTHDEFPVENMSLSRCKTLLASCSHDEAVRFWNIDSIKHETVDASKKARKRDKSKVLNKAMAKEEFFADMEEEGKEEGEEEESGDSDDDSDEDVKPESINLNAAATGENDKLISGEDEHLSGDDEHLSGEDDEISTGDEDELLSGVSEESLSDSDEGSKDDT